MLKKRAFQKTYLMRQYRQLGYLFDLVGGVFANRSGDDRLKPIESGEFANTVWCPIDAAATIVAGGFFTRDSNAEASS